MSSFFVLTLHDVLGLAILGVCALLIGLLFAAHYAERGIARIKRWWRE